MEKHIVPKNLKVWIAVFLMLFILGIASFEFIWKARVVGGHEMEEILIALRHNAAVAKTVGQVMSADFSRMGSKADIGLLGSESKGSYRFAVKGTKKTMDMLVIWHSRPPSNSLVIDKIESIEDWQRTTIWEK